MSVPIKFVKLKKCLNNVLKRKLDLAKRAKEAASKQ